MKKFKFFSIISLLFFIVISYTSQGEEEVDRCDKDNYCVPVGTGCNYVCLDEVYCVGNMDPLEEIDPIEPEL